MIRNLRDYAMPINQSTAGGKKPRFTSREKEHIMLTRIRAWEHYLVLERGV